MHLIEKQNDELASHVFWKICEFKLKKKTNMW